MGRQHKICVSWLNPGMGILIQWLPNQDSDGRKLFINERTQMRTLSKPPILCRMEVSCIGCSSSTCVYHVRPQRHTHARAETVSVDRSELRQFVRSRLLVDGLSFVIQCSMRHVSIIQQLYSGLICKYLLVLQVRHAAVPIRDSASSHNLRGQLRRSGHGGLDESECSDRRVIRSCCGCGGCFRRHARVYAGARRRGRLSERGGFRQKCDAALEVCHVM